MVKFTVLHLGEHTIDNMTVTGPFAQIILQMAPVFLAEYTGSEQERDLAFAHYVLRLSSNQGEIIEHTPSPPATHH